ncbi:MAG: OmpH family outer membrane protein [Bdellovibrionaceae bacterium]|nr:OmpH family outer membrane protein [Pseudobdellovibrionaceae bacterium]
MFTGFKWSLAVLIYGFSISVSAKTVFVNMQYVLQTVKAGKNAKAVLSKEFNKKRKFLSKQEKVLKQLGKDLEKKRSVLSDVVFLQKQKNLQEKVLKYRESVSKSQADIQKRERKLTVPILKNVQALIKSLAKKNKYSLVLDRQSIVWASKNIDITETVVKAYNKKHRR